MHETTPLDFPRIAQDLQIRKLQVESVVQLLDEGNTIPFIARYRRERTGGLGEDVIRQVQARVRFQRQLADRKQTIVKSIEAQGKLTDELRQAILKADTSKRLEDLFLPYKPKKKSQASAARDKGLAPLALAIWHSDPAAAGSLDELLPVLVNPDRDVKTTDDVKNGVQQILAEMMADAAEVRAPVRMLMWETGKIVGTKSDKVPEGQGLEYKDYFQFSEAARQIPPHRILGLYRGEKDNAIKVKLEVELDKIRHEALVGLAGLLARVAGKQPTSERSAVTGQGPELESQKASATEAPGAGPESQAPSPPAAETAPPCSEATPPAASPPEEAPPVPAAQATTSEPTSPPPAPEPAPPAATAEAEAAPLAAPELAPIPEPRPLTPVASEPLIDGHAFSTPHAAFLRNILDDALQRLVLPSLEREIRRELNDEAESHAVSVFARNLRSLLMQPPMPNRRVLAIDPGYRTGCKVVALDEHGNLLEHANIYPFGGGPRRPREKPLAKIPDTAPPGAAASAAQAPSVETPAPAPEAAPPPIEAAPAVDAHAPTPEAAIDAAAAPETPPLVEASAPPAETGAAAPTEHPPAPAPQAEAAAEGINPPVEAPAAAPQAAVAAEPAAPAPDKRAEAKAALLDLIQKHQLPVVALGNGPGCRDMEELLADLMATHQVDLAYAVVNEAGASAFAVGPVGREELPEYDAAVRSAMSIGRRLQDPLSELVKIEPQNLGVGLHPQDLARRELRDMLEGVVESCVNQVGVDVNTAGVPLLRYVAGLNQLLARDLVDYRKQHGPFSAREQLLQVPNLGPERFAQAAGFITVHGTNPLDRTRIHPESYALAEKILAELGSSAGALTDPGAQPELQQKLRSVNVEEAARVLEVGPATVFAVLEALAEPGYDPRADLPAPILRKGLLKLEDLQPGMELKGTVLNVVEFGAFVDVGMKDSGLVHISQIANRYIKSPHDVVAVNDIVTVWVLSMDKERGRVSLTLIKPGTERAPPERRSGPAEDRRDRPPRGRRPGGPPPQGQRSGEARGPGPGAGAQRGGSRPPPRGGRPGDRGPGGRGPSPAPAPAGAEGAPAARNQPPPPPPPPPRKPRRQPPKPKLSQEALEGKAPLRTFGELSALFHARKAPPPEPAPAPPPVAETPPEPAPAAPAEPPPAGESPPPGP